MGSAVTRTLWAATVLAVLGGVTTGCAAGEDTTDVKAIQAEAQSSVPKNVPTMSKEDMAKIQQGQMGGPPKGGR